MKLRIGFCILCCFFSNLVLGQLSNLKFENLNTMEGLSSSTCLEIFQDREGLLWFGTIDGLNQYDGYEFKTYRHILKDSTSISNNRINAIVEDKNGNLWIGTNNGLNFFERDLNKFSRVNLNTQSLDTSIDREFINHLLYDEIQNILWIATNDGAVKIILEDQFKSLDNLRFSFYEHNNYDKNSLDDNGVKVILKDNENVIWISTNGENLNKYNSEKDNFDRNLIRSKGDYELNYIPKKILIDNDGDFWIGNDLSNLVLWEKRINKFRHLSLATESIPVVDFFQDKSGLIWISTDGYGLFLFDKEKNCIQHVLNNPSDPFSLPNGQISKVIEDNNGIFWIGHYDKGISKLDRSKSSFGHYYYQGGNNNGLTARTVSSVLQDSNNRIWISTYNGGLNLFDELNNTFQLFEHNKKNKTSLSSNKILYTFESYNGNIWVCTLDGGLNNFNPETKETKRFLHESDNLFSIGRNAICMGVEDNKNRVWLGLRDEGVNLFDPKAEKFYSYKKSIGKENSLISDFVLSLFVDSKNRLLVGTSLGLNVVDLNTLDEFIPEDIQFLEIKEDGIIGNQINYMTEDYLGNIWLGTENGVFKLDADLKLVKSYFSQDGLPNNLITGLKEDSDHNFWIATKSGLSFLDSQTQKFTNFNEKDGLQGTEYQSRSIEKTNDGRIIIGGIDGFNIFHPDNVLLESSIVLASKLTNFKINNKKIVVGDTLNSRFVFQKPIAQIENLILNHDQTNISLEFVALYFKNPEHVSYAYKMNGLDEQFITAGSNRIAIYSNLQPGNYMFEVKASINGNWEEARVSHINIEVLSPPWKTWWAYSIYFILVFTIVWGVYYFYSKRTIEERKYELDQMKLKFFINVSHEFRTPLTLILNPLDKILSNLTEPEKIKTSVESAQRSSRRLLYLVNQLLDYRKMDMGMAPLKLEKGDIVSFCNENFSLFKDLAKTKGIEYKFKTNSKKITALFDFDKIEKIFTNLISNAIKFTNKGGEITVSIERVSEVKKKSKVEFLEIRVVDSGIGIKKEQLKYVFSRFFKADTLNSGTGIGLNFTKGLVELHGGEINVDSQYETGSTFIVRLPLKVKGKTEVVEKVKNEFLINSMKSAEYEMSISNDDIIVENNKEPEISRSRLPVVLIVEDNKELRLFIKNELENSYRIKEAVNGAMGLKMVSKYNPDIVISDVMMPKMDGFEMCKAIKSEFETCHVPVILLTARSLEEDRIEGYETGADGYLSKPFEINVLKARIQNLLETKKRVREKFSKLGGILPSNELTTNNLDEAFLEKATNIIIKNISSVDFKLDDLLKEINIGRSHFYRKIQSLTGQNPSNFVRTIRLKYASELLLKGNYSIKEVSHMAGFNSTAYFSKTFRNVFEITPTEFTKKNKSTKKLNKL